ncbi:hypothetical protein [Hymenobacter cavernae]|uniref:Uncharacterized protein n=1 Tax=Hymenobacter cavernae TaxID=2044852 RepID=A0ABQ1UTV8_9BACT|nr:hypothetical protein [Hymenobacter cavernae]GGF25808.1 hypothetical protein GCM10011383_41710 [Hymenobacter cavernae]
MPSFLLSVVLALAALPGQVTPARTAAVKPHATELPSHLAVLPVHKKIQKSAAARRPKRVLIIKSTINDQL